jgi:hypothetical protein
MRYNNFLWHYIMIFDDTLKYLLCPHEITCKTCYLFSIDNNFFEDFKKEIRITVSVDSILQFYTVDWNVWKTCGHGNEWEIRQYFSQIFVITCNFIVFTSSIYPIFKALSMRWNVLYCWIIDNGHVTYVILWFILL